MNGKLVIHYSDTGELVRKLHAVLDKLEPPPERISVGQLARRVGRKTSTVTMALQRPSCPPYDCLRGKRRIIWVEVNAELLEWLKKNRKGERCDILTTTACNLK